METDINSLVLAQIKEKLKSFNLPMIPVATDDTVYYKDRCYIKGTSIVRCVDTTPTFKTLYGYKYGDDVINLTKNLLMSSVIYDDYTHEYLGNYLRFIRDYDHLNLMGLYNCFFGTELLSTRKTYDKIDFLIDTSDNLNKYYIVPVKLNKTYTIAIDSNVKYDLACIIHNNVLVESTDATNIVNATHRIISGSTFTAPYTFSTKISGDTTWRRESDLKLLIKIPKLVESSIVVLEGDYTNSSDVLDGMLITDLVCGDEADDLNIMSKLSLLKFNNKRSYPFADRLVEYITGHAITPRDDIYGNISLVQKEVYMPRYEYLKGYDNIWDGELSNEIKKIVHEDDPSKTKGLTNSNIYYIVEEESSEGSEGSEGPSFVEVQTVNKVRYIDSYYDTLGAVDKDLNKALNILYSNYINRLEK